MTMGTNGGARSGTATIDGADIYHEVRGEGIPVLFVPGANDAASFRPVAEALADTFTVVTFDLRGTSRSPRPEGWTQTSVGELAEDAAGLVNHLGLAPVVAFGTSAGGAIAVEMVLRHPELVRGVVVHDPFILTFLDDQLPAVMAQLQEDVGKGMAAGGPRLAADGFYRSFVGDAVWEGLDDESRERLLGNGEVMFEVLLGASPATSRTRRVWPR
jgi:pimeloyl-ACP methyl ester carboxylesterase